MIKIEDVVTYENLYKCYCECLKGKSNRDMTIKYSQNYVKNLHRLRNRILSGKYEISRLYNFVIYEPKKRSITANQFEDKIVQKLISDYVLYPTIYKKLIYDNYASQPKKGNLLAIKRLAKFCYKFAKDNNWSDEGYVLTCDIKKFFYTINRSILKQMIDKLKIDDKLKSIIYLQIDSYNPEFNEYTDDPNKGICIGFQVSQWLAVYYLDSLDHFIKEELKIKYYGRYMDDFYLIHKDKNYLEYCMNKIKTFCETKLDLKLNKKTHIHEFKQGVCFLGFHMTYDPKLHRVICKIRNGSIKRMLKRVNCHIRLIEDGLMSYATSLESLKSWFAYIEYGCDNKTYNKFIKTYNKILSLSDLYLTDEEIKEEIYDILEWEYVEVTLEELTESNYNILINRNTSHISSDHILYPNIKPYPTKEYLQNIVLIDSDGFYHLIRRKQK